MSTGTPAGDRGGAGSPGYPGSPGSSGSPGAAPARAVITGLGVVTAIGADVPSFTAALRTGVSGIQAVPLPPPSPPGARRLLAPLADIDLNRALERLDSATRRRCTRAARRSPPPVRAALAAAAEAWQNADLTAAPVPGERLGLVVGGHNLAAADAFGLYAAYQREPAHIPPRFALQVQDTDHVGVLSEALGITGEGGTVGASSASGNAALLHAARLVRLGVVDVCLAVGAMARLGPLEFRALANLGALAAAEAGCRPFDRDRAGFVPGEAAACLVVESAAGAAARGVSALAEIAGAALVLDGNSLSDPNRDGEARAMAAALAEAGVAPAAVDYVNAHGTGTPAGDDTEAAALEQVLGAAAGRPWVNSTKALTGHCLSAAGVVEAVAVVAQMRGGFVHGMPALRDPIPSRLRFAGPGSRPAVIDCALSTAFGFGGFNSAVVLKRIG